MEEMEPRLSIEFIPGTVIELHCSLPSLTPFVALAWVSPLPLADATTPRLAGSCRSWVEELLQTQGSIP